MVTEDWVELIKNVLSPSAFKEVAMAALRAQHGVPVLLADGTGDGGVDAWIDLPSGRIPVQFHAGRAQAWDAKLARDLGAHDVLREHGRMFFVCAQTPALDTRLKQVARLEREHGVTITVMDAREIASMASDPQVLAALSRVVGITPAERASRRSDAALDARLAFMFFHDKSGDFRAEVARSVLSACLLRESEPIEMDKLLERAIDAAGIPGAVRRPFRQELEALATEGMVEVRDGRVAATSTLREITQSVLDIQAAAAKSLREECVRALDQRIHLKHDREAAVEDVFDDLGLLLRESLAETLPGRASDATTMRLNAVERRLSDHLKPGGGSAAEALKVLVDVAAASPYGRALAAAEVFIQMADRDSAHLATSLARRSRLVIWLDASVALPMLCGLHDRIAEGWATSEIAVELHGALLERDIEAVVPSVYLEEMAAHLIEAARRYRPLIGADPDLARSENFYVAHFHAVAQCRGETATLPQFDRFLQDFGLPRQWEELSESNFTALRRRIERELELLFKRYYGIGVHRIKSTDAIPLPDEPDRSDIVLRHDRCVARDLEETAHGMNEGILLCSEDRWFVRVLTEKDILALNPAVFLDLLQIVRPTARTRQLAAVRKLAETFSERVVARGAAAWDLVAQLVSPGLSNRDLLQQAREFKEEYLRRKNHQERPLRPSDWYDWQRIKAGRTFGA